MINLTVDLSGAMSKLKEKKNTANFLDQHMMQLAGLLETEVKRETPVLTGNLRSSIIGKKTGYLQAEVGTNANYARYVEYGTSRFEPRAMFRKGAESFKAKAQAFLENKIKALKL